MIEKTPWVTLVENLRAILLIEADFKFGNRLIFGNKMVKSLETKGDLPQDSFGSRNSFSSIDAPICRGLFFDVARKKKFNAILGSYDTHSWYDRIVHSFSSLVAQSVGVPQHGIDCILSAIQKMRVYVRTNLGDSTTLYDSEMNIWQGLCHGDGVLPALWLLISSYLLKYLKSKGCSIRIPAAISGATISYVALGYVDDGDFPSIDTTTNETEEVVEYRHRHTVNFWSQGYVVRIPNTIKVYLLSYQLEIETR